MKKIIPTLCCIAQLLACSSLPAAEPDQAWRKKLYIPTFLGKHQENYIIVNCWQHRLIYNDKLDEGIEHWKTLDEEIAGPHSFATYKNFLIAEDTGRDALILYRWEDGNYARIQRLEGLPRRPHRVQWDTETHAVWVLSSNNQKLYRIKFEEKSPMPLSIDTSWDLPFLKSSYTRSFSIIGGEFYFVSGPSQIHVIAYPEEEIKVIGSYKIPALLGGKGGMNDIFKSSNGWWYFSSTTKSSLIRAQSLEELSKENYEDVKPKIGLKGTPYYLSEFEGKIWVTSIYTRNGIVSFEEDDREIINVQHHFDFGQKTPVDARRGAYLPK